MSSFDSSNIIDKSSSGTCCSYATDTDVSVKLSLPVYSDLVTDRERVVLSTVDVWTNDYP